MKGESIGQGDSKHTLASLLYLTSDIRFHKLQDMATKLLCRLQIASCSMPLDHEA